MPNRRHLYYVGDVPTFRGVFEIEGEEQTPDAGTCTVTIRKKVEGEADTVVVTDVAGTISGNQLQYKPAALTEGRFAIFLTATYGNGADKRTGVIECVFKNKEAN